MKPTVGRIVHYFPPRSDVPQPAVVLRVGVHYGAGYSLDLSVFQDDDAQPVRVCTAVEHWPEDAKRPEVAPGYTVEVWRWPPREGGSR